MSWWGNLPGWQRALMIGGLLGTGGMLAGPALGLGAAGAAAGGAGAAGGVSGGLLGGGLAEGLGAGAAGELAATSSGIGAAGQAANPLSLIWGNLNSQMPGMGNALGAAGKMAIASGSQGQPQSAPPPMQRQQQPPPESLMSMLPKNGITNQPSMASVAGIRARASGMTPEQYLRMMMMRGQA